jgi:AraC-like DNA-binding protein
MNYNPDIQHIQRLVGPVTEEQIRFIDSYVSDELGLFIPVAGPCYYALMPEHVHPSYMVIYSFKGEAEGWINGIKQSAMKPGDFLFMAPNIQHQEKESAETPNYLAMCIMPDLVESIAVEYNIRLELIRSIVKVTKAQKQFLPLCWQFLAEAKVLHPNKSLLHAISVQIVHTVIRSVFQNTELATISEWRAEVGQTVAFIHSHLHEKINLQDMAGAANMSVPNFCRVFKKEMEQTPNDYLMEQRLYKAQKMLLSDEFSVQEIALSCGYTSVSYLSSAFKKRFKVSPEKYKMQMIP